MKNSRTTFVCASPTQTKLVLDLTRLFDIIFNMNNQYLHNAETLRVFSPEPINWFEFILKEFHKSLKATTQQELLFLLEHIKVLAKEVLVDIPKFEFESWLKTMLNPLLKDPHWLIKKLRCASAKHDVIKLIHDLILYIQIEIDDLPCRIVH